MSGIQDSDRLQFAPFVILGAITIPMFWIMGGPFGVLIALGLCFILYVPARDLHLHTGSSRDEGTEGDVPRSRGGSDGE